MTTGPTTGAGKCCCVQAPAGWLRLLSPWGAVGCALVLFVCVFFAREFAKYSGERQKVLVSENKHNVAFSLSIYWETSRFSMSSLWKTDYKRK